MNSESWVWRAIVDFAIPIQHAVCMTIPYEKRDSFTNFIFSLSPSLISYSIRGCVASRIRKPTDFNTHTYTYPRPPSNTPNTQSSHQSTYAVRAFVPMCERLHTPGSPLSHGDFLAFSPRVKEYSVKYVQQSSCITYYIFFATGRPHR